MYQPGLGTDSRSATRLFGFLLLARLVVVLHLAVREVLHQRDGLFEDGGRLANRRHQQRLAADSSAAYQTKIHTPDRSVLHATEIC